MKLLTFVAVLITVSSAVPTHWKTGRVTDRGRTLVQSKDADLVSYQRKSPQGTKEGAAVRVSTMAVPPTSKGAAGAARITAGVYENTKTGTVIQGPGVRAAVAGFNEKNRKGVMIDAGIQLGKVENRKFGVTVGPSIRTGISKFDGQTEAHLAGFGVSVGPKTTGVHTPIGSVYKKHYVDDDFYDESDDGTFDEAESDFDESDAFDSFDGDFDDDA
ncbi:hypothetical protein HDV03_001564 [Kappamyces sp. JEL0829]|nr:hypothetical protein HDV03_001564 [Kappamyces sp. JEL0829]